MHDAAADFGLISLKCADYDDNVSSESPIHRGN